MARGATKFVFSAGASPYEVYTGKTVIPKDVNNFFKYIIGPEKLTTYSYDLAEAIESGVDPKTAAVSTGISILMDAYLTGRLATAGAKQLSKLFPEEQHLAAWGTLGTPNTMAEAKQSFNNLQRKYHPDRPGGNVAISKQINNAYEVLKKQGIPDSNLVKTKLGQLGNALLSTPEYSEITNAVRLQRPNLFPQLEGQSIIGKPQLNIGGGTIQPVMPSKRARELQELAKKQGVPTNVATYDTIVKQTELNKAKQFINKNQDSLIPYLEGKKDLPKNVMNNALVTELKNYIANTSNLSPEFLQAAANSPLLTKTSEIAQEMGLLSPTDEDTFVGRVKQIEKVKKQKAKVSLKPYSPEQSGITKEQAAHIDALTKVNQQLRSKLNPETNT